MKGPIQSVEVTFFLHETEDRAKVEQKVAEVLSTGTPPETTELDGHFGNKILVYRFHLIGPDAERAVNNISRKMDQGGRQAVLRDLGSAIDEHSALFLRLDKQALVMGDVVIGSEDPVRLKVKPRAFVAGKDPVEFFRRLLAR